ncbi:hypothetical protein [Desulfoluna spongiiphila]|uniref:Uncharacterized protein n=1 Tax=Desulfoluna spongiiphila TaxID=419481 RepID=A0A1G5F3Y7_9BACT|nr:hypothetical protein [Desulfoluna spongiiphila]SCY33348.1 hypothetical protein SAMN05216233_10789 [Desulfoluna spongiiphila]VVS94361.1 hypothetical protein DBB_39330 [Desulfoluna spongiiphila]
MGIYPKKDCEITLCLSNNSQLDGLVNIVGRDIRTFLLDNESDIVMYEAVNGEDESRRPMIVPKKHILWVEVRNGDLSERKVAIYRKMKMKMTNGQVVSGEIDITGYDRVSDYFLKNTDMFSEVSRVAVDGESVRSIVFVSTTQYLWVIPDEDS